MTRHAWVLAVAVVFAAPLATSGEAADKWSGICEVKIVECPLMTFEAVREAGDGGSVPGALSAEQVALLWKSVDEKKAKVVLSAEVAASPGQLSRWRAGRTHSYLADYNVEGDAVASTVGRIELGWTVSLRPYPAHGGGFLVDATVEHRSMVDGKASVATPHGALETPIVSVRSVRSVAKMPARSVNVLGLIPATVAGGAGPPVVQVVLMRTDLPETKPIPVPMPAEQLPDARSRGGRDVIRRMMPPKQSFVSVKVMLVPDVLLDKIRAEAGDSAAGAEISGAQLEGLAKAVKDGEARIVEAGALGCFADYGGHVRAGTERVYISGYNLFPVKARGAAGADGANLAPTVMLADPVAESLFSGFSAKLAGSLRALSFTEGRACVIWPWPAGPVRIECASETATPELRSVDGPHGKVQVPSTSSAGVAAPLKRGAHGAYLLGGATGQGDKPGLKRVVLVEVESEK